MPYNLTNLPYIYENEDDPQTLANGVIRQRIWAYSVEQSAQVKRNGMLFPVIVEKMTCRTRYQFADYDVQYGVVHEWHYIDSDDEPRPNRMLGYRQYHEGDLLKSEQVFLQPEVAIALAFTPDREHVPAYLEISTVEALEKLLYRLSIDLKDAGQLNAWMPPPAATPHCAPEDIANTMSQMRRDVGLSVTRGRGKLLRAVMDATGLEITESGWTLTDNERTRRLAHTTGAAQ